jgi:hypothetical protein
MKRVIIIVFCFLSVQIFGQRIDREVPGNSLVYALPRTNIEISVEIIRDKYIPGPYVRYADEHLSIQDVSAREETSYSIGTVSMKQMIEADYEYMYALPVPEKSTLDASFLALSSEGLIFSLHDPTEIMVDFVSTSFENYQLYPDRLPSSPLDSQKEFIMERVQTDSGFVSIPVQQNIVEKKDDYSKAKEASNFIFSLRKRRFELITGDVENAFSGSSLKDALQEINRLEKEYLSLFIGKHFVENRVFRFYVCPDNTELMSTKAYPVFHFSKFEGVLPEATRTTEPFVLNITPSGKINYVEGIENKTKMANIYYRIPETVTVQLQYGKEEVCSGRMQIYQMGKEFVLPFDVKLK